jgi:endonuclease III related protein
MSVNGREQIMKIYKELYAHYGPQGWWPLMDLETWNPDKIGATHGYHPLNYDLPETPEQRYEIIIGAILTQNTVWSSAEKALLNLKEMDVIHPQKLLAMDDNLLKEAIRCAGFLNQKSVYLKEISLFFIALHGQIPIRKELLKVKGVGNETADSILLYAYYQMEFVVDAYTRRIFSNLDLVDEQISYMTLKKLFEENLPLDVPIYQEYHALIVEHAKRYYQKKPYGVDDPLKE